MQLQHAQAKPKLSTTSHLVTNLAYKLQPHHKWNQYLREHLDICADVNIMPASVHKLIFSDPDYKEAAPSKLEMGTYTTETFILVGSCTFHLVHPDTKWPQEVTFYVASTDGSGLLSCATTFALDLIQPCTRLGYLPPRASLITSSADHQRKTKCQLTVHVSKRNASCPINQVQYPSLSQTRNRSCKLIPKCLMEFDIFLDHPTTYKSLQASPPSRLHANQCQFISKSHSDRKLTKCCKLVSWCLYTKLHLG